MGSRRDASTTAKEAGTFRRCGGMMLRQFALLGLLVFGLLALAGCGSDLVGPTPTDGAPASAPGVNLEVPDLMISAYQGETALGGEEVALSSVLAQGKPVVLNFWAALCPPCRAEMPDIQAVHDEFKDRVVIFGVDIGPFVGLGNKSDATQLIRDLGVTYPTGATNEPGVISTYRVLGMPTTVFLTPDGKVKRTWTGLLTEAKLVELVEELMAASGA
jgi:cytochrome c biogenesis protein CcmG/thiol:disulfide interchange protein DsbE